MYVSKAPPFIDHSTGVGEHVHAGAKFDDAQRVGRIAHRALVLDEEVLRKVDRGVPQQRTCPRCTGEEWRELVFFLRDKQRQQPLSVRRARASIRTLQYQQGIIRTRMSESERSWPCTRTRMLSSTRSTLSSANTCMSSSPAFAVAILLHSLLVLQIKKRKANRKSTCIKYAQCKKYAHLYITSEDLGAWFPLKCGNRFERHGSAPSSTNIDRARHACSRSFVRGRAARG